MRGNSEWHERDLFVGWYDSKLSMDGQKEAKRVADVFHNAGVQFDIGITSELTRAKDTLDIILHELEQNDVTVNHTWLLNAQHVGSLTGLNKSETVAEYSFEQVDYWTQYYTSSPPAMREDHKYHDQITRNFKDLVKYIPNSESVMQTQNRIIYYWNNKIVPLVEQKHTILLCCHQTGLETLNKYLGEIEFEEGVCQPTLKPPFYYEFNEDMQTIKQQTLE